MKKTFKIAIIFSIIATILILASTALAISGEDFSSIFKVFGKIEKEFVDTKGSSGDSDIYVKCEDFVIYKSEVKKITEQNKLAGLENEEERAVKFLLKREVLYFEAQKQGYATDDQEVRDLIALNIESAKASENYERDFIPFLEGIGMTNEEYWESQYDVFKKDIVISQYIAAERELFADKNGYWDADKSGYKNWEEFQTKWQEQYEKLVDELIKTKDLHYSKG